MVGRVWRTQGIRWEAPFSCLWAPAKCPQWNPWLLFEPVAASGHVMSLTDQNSALRDCSDALMTWPLPPVLGQFPKPSWKCNEAQNPSPLGRVKLKNLCYTLSCFSVKCISPLPIFPPLPFTDALACLDAESSSLYFLAGTV